MSRLIDLHVHTTASDGALSPEEVVEEAARQGLAALAVTDHDTVEGVDEAQAAGRRLGVEVVAGLEFSVKRETPGYMHLLGLLVDQHHPDLNRTLARISDGRDERNARIVDRLGELGLPISLEQVLAISGRGETGKPHIARALFEAGHVASPEEALAKYLKRGRPAYVERFRLSAAEAVELIHRAGGLAVLAHPISLDLTGPKLSEVLRRLKADGLDGLEVQTPTQNEAFRLWLLGAAEKLDLLVSGGSDFHGDYKPDIRLGFGRGDLRVKIELLEALKRARLARQAAA